MSASPAPRLHPLGDAALLCELPAPARLDVQQKIWALASEAVAWPGVGEALPGMNNLTLMFDPGQTDAEALGARILALWPRLRSTAIAGREVRIPVAYGGDDGPDLGDVAAHTGLSAAEVVKRHCAGEYIVYLLGFLPGLHSLAASPPNSRHRAVPSRERPCRPARSASAASRLASTPWCRRAAGN